ncbi:MAG: 5-formyltetrahydrofolate cyclo-ligase [Verrucomicrobiales bacterium]
MKDKASLRRELRRELAQLTPAQSAAASARICQHLAAYLKSNIAQNIALFAATPREPRLDALHALLPHHRFHYPLCAAEGRMSFHHVNDPSELQRGRHDIAAPNAQSHPEISPTELDLILCPGLAFTPQGLRLGQGGGYYDRYLPQAPQALTLGVAFSSQILSELPHQPHDIRLQGLVTENTLTIFP